MLCDCHVYPTLPARDLARARRFYEQTLGFEPVLVTPGGIIYDALGSRFFVYPSQYAGTNQATALAFDVDDLPKIVGELKSRGVRFEEYDMPEFKSNNGIVQTPDGPGAWLKDTEGNILGLFQPVRAPEWPREKVAAGRSA
jgi:catechol 2,3-dioxygenase-like lactoylglutathione lyase family enzyme